MITDVSEVTRHACCRGRPDYFERLFEISCELESPKAFLEVGSAIGGSAIALATPHREDPEFRMYCIDCLFMSGEQWEECGALHSRYKLGRNLAMDAGTARDGTNRRYFRENTEAAGLELIVIPIGEYSIKVHMLGPLDLVYIDGTHTYQAVKEDLRFLHLVPPGGFAVLDDWGAGVRRAALSYFRAYREWERVDDKHPEWFMRKRRSR